MKRLANCTNELTFFQNMVTGKNDQRILLIQAESGYGKTGLMIRFADLCPKETIAVRLDLKAAGGLGIAYVFYRIRKVLSTYQFLAYEAAIGRFLAPGQSEVEIRNNDLSGDQSLIQVVLQGNSETERQLRLSQLQSAFFKDLQQCASPIVFILDTFNEATPELQHWISGNFLMEVADNQRLYSVVAGQEVPKPSIEWESLHHKYCLFAINDHGVWYEYAKDEGYPFDLKELGVLVDLFQGVPHLVEKALQTVTQNRQSS
jgi:hypothetical protein